MSTTKSRVKWAQVFWLPDHGLLEYQCAKCQLKFGSEILCLEHVKKCFIDRCKSDVTQPQGRLDNDDNTFEESDCLLTEPMHNVEVNPQNLSETRPPDEVHENFRIDQCSDISKKATVNHHLYGSSTNPNRNSRGIPSDENEEEYIYSMMLLMRIKQACGRKNYLKCDICKLHFFCRSEILAHMQRKHMRMRATRVQCDQCEKTCLSTSILKLHKHGYHNQDTLQFPCKKCYKIFDSEMELKKHRLDVHFSRLFICDVCGVFKTRFLSNFRDHMRIHTGERPYICELCGKPNRSKGDLNVHMKIMHIKVKSKQCVLCPRAFKIQSALTRHIRLTHNKQHSYHCSICPRKCATNGELRKHMCSHTGLRPYACSDCDKSFVEPSTLRDHQNRYHTNTNLYSCRHCERMFPSSHSRNAHERAVHKSAAADTAALKWIVDTETLQMSNNPKIHINVSEIQ